MKKSNKGQAVIELAFQIPLMLALLFGCVQIARVFYIYHTLEKAVRGGAGLLSRSNNVDYCNASDPTVTDAKNFMVYGNLQGEGTPIVQGLTPDLIQVIPERQVPDTTGVAICACTEGTDGCDLTAGGTAPDFVVVNLGNGFPLAVPFPMINLGTFSLRVSVRMPMTGS